MTKTERLVSRAAHWLSVWGVAAACFVLLGAALAAASWYGYRELERLTERVAALEGALASTTVALTADIAKANAALSASLSSSLAAQGAHVADVAASVSTLEKLQQLDPELLAKYSKVYFLNENYMPERLALIPSAYRYYDDRPMQFIPEALPKLEAMLEAATTSGVTLYVYSAYRSFAEQRAIKDGYTIVYGAGTANSFSADQGYSEHQLGTTVDLITTGVEGRLTPAFDQTGAYRWLIENAHRYGFALSYPKGNEYYSYEPWHWRYVGVALATRLHDRGEFFYDLDQRTIDAYLVNLFD